MHKNFEAIYMDQSKIWTERMNPSLSQQAQSLISGIIGQIFNKATDKFKEMQATVTLDHYLTDMLNYLKQIVFNNKLRGNSDFSDEQFNLKIEAKASATR